MKKTKEELEQYERRFEGTVPLVIYPRSPYPKTCLPNLLESELKLRHGLYQIQNIELNKKYNILAGEGYPVFKAAAIINQEIGMVGRYSIDQANQLLAHYDPCTKAVLNAVHSRIDYTIDSIIPDSVKSNIQAAHSSLMSKFPTENEKFIVNTAGGILLAELGGAAIQAAIKPIKIGANVVNDKLKHMVLNEPALQEASSIKLFDISNSASNKGALRTNYDTNALNLKEVSGNPAHSVKITELDSLKLPTKPTVKPDVAVNTANPIPLHSSLILVQWLRQRSTTPSQSSRKGISQ